MRGKPNARKLKKNRNTTVPQYYCFVDTETIPQEVVDGQRIQSFRLGVAVFLRLRSDGYRQNREILYFSNMGEFWDNVVSFVKGKNTLNIIAHNALFDMRVLEFERHLTERGFECRFIFEQGLTFISKWRNKDRRIMILDNTNWFQGKLEKWGEKLGFAKMTMPKFNADDKVWQPYCLRDVEILEKLQLWLLDFIVENDLGNWKYTLSSLSFNAYRHRFMDYPIYIPAETRETYLARQSYRGGRTECFYSGKLTNGPFYKLDINSMYPYVMALNDYPTNVEGLLRSVSLDDITKLLTQYALIGHFKVKLHNAWIPHKVNKKTCYPLGTFKTFLSTPEITVLLKENSIVECMELAVYRKRPIFEEFVKFFYNERIKWIGEGDELRGYMFKLFLNSLYGKMGQRGYDDKVIGNAPMGTYKTSYYYDAITGDKGVTRQIGENIIKSLKKGEGYNAFVAIASHVTGYARIMLYSLILQAGQDNVFYCDTDSLFVNNAGYRNLGEFIHSQRLGALKVEGVTETLEIISPKHYGFGEEWKIKGISKSAEYLGNDTYRQEVWPRLNTLINSKVDGYFNYFVTKHLTAGVSSGIINSEGKVQPFILKE